MTDKLREALEALPTYSERLHGIEKGPALYDGQDVFLRREDVLAALAAAPQPAPEREELVRLLQIITRNGSLDDGRTLHEVIADALLARGLRLPGGEETMAWAVVGEDGKIDPRKLWINSRDAEEYCERGERAVRVAIRVVEGGDDAA